jgi:hypothetical protein
VRSNEGIGLDPFDDEDLGHRDSLDDDALNEHFGSLPVEDESQDPDDWRELIARQVPREQAGRRLADRIAAKRQMAQKQVAEKLRAAQRVPPTTADLRAALEPLTAHADPATQRKAEEALRLLAVVETGPSAHADIALRDLTTLALRQRVKAEPRLGRLWQPVHRLGFQLERQRRR